MTVIGLALGGGLGALARYRLTGLIAPRQQTPFPLGTLTVNVVGSFALGLLVRLGTNGTVSPTWLTWAGTGFLGAFTTFSTFTYETLRLVEDGAWRYALWNIAISGPLSFLAAAAGYLLAA